MASSPDVSSYVDLTVYDEDPVSILNDILSSARGLLPGWQPEAGQIEVVLAEAFANRTSQLAAAINRLPSATTEVLLQLFGVTRSDGANATATLDIQLFADTTLYEGTQFLYYDEGEARSFVFKLDDDLAGVAGLNSGVAVTADSVGTAYNSSTAVGRGLALLTSNDRFESAVFATNPTTGLDAETDQEYFTRGTTLLASYTTASATASQIKFYVSSNKNYVNRVEVFNRRRYRDRDTTAAGYGTHDGAMLIAVADRVSTGASAGVEVPVSANNLSDLYTSVVERIPSGLTVDVMSAELASVDVTVTVVKKSGTVASTVRSDIEAALAAYLDPNVWDWSQNVVRQNELIALIDGVSGVDYIQSLTLDGTTVIGSNNIGYYTTSGGTKTTVNLDISGVAPDSPPGYDVGQLSFYYVDADETTPVLYEFTNAASVVITGGAATNQPFEAVANGLLYNDTNNGGKVDPAATYPGTGSAGAGSPATLGQATLSSGSAFTGGSDDTNQFTVLNGTGSVDSDVTLRNLGTLVTYGALDITVT